MILPILTTLSILGTWQFAGFLYQGKFVQPPNPNLVVQFTFANNNQDHLIWYRTNESGFCERRGEYSFKDGVLWHHTTWINPKNAPSCASDSDMQPDATTVMETRWIGEQLALVMHLNEEPLLYLLDRVQIPTVGK